MVIKRSKKLCRRAPWKQMIMRFSSLGKKGGYKYDGEERLTPADVPRGHFAVYVGENRRRYIIPISFLSRPEFWRLLERAEEEFGFYHQMGITLPCDERVFRALTSK